MTDLDLRMIRHFLAVVDRRSFTDAARDLHLTQPALSQSIRRLEGTIGVPLLIRGPRGSTRAVTLTDAGEALSAAAPDLLIQAEAAVRAARSHTDPIEMRVGFTASIPRELTSAAIEVADDLTGVSVTLCSQEWGAEVNALRGGAVDVAFLQTPADPSAPDVDAREVARMDRVAVFPAAHRLSGATSIDIADLDDEPIVDAATERDFWLATPRPSRRPLTVVGPPARTVDEMLAAVAAGRGMAITTASIAARSRSEDLAFVALHGVDPVRIHLAWRRSDRRPQVAAMVSALLARRAAASGTSV